MFIFDTKTEASHFAGTFDHPSQEIELQPLHVDQLLRRHAPGEQHVMSCTWWDV